jgi:hypothetical protein
MSAPWYRNGCLMCNCVVARSSRSSQTARVALTGARTGRLFPCDGELPLAELLGVLPAGASLAVEAPVANLAGRTVGERTRLAYAALTGLLAKADQASHQADAR